MQLSIWLYLDPLSWLHIGVANDQSFQEGLVKLSSLPQSNVFVPCRCNGSEKTLGECTKKNTGRIAQGCGHIGDVGVVCNRPTTCDNPDEKVREAAASWLAAKCRHILEISYS